MSIFQTIKMSNSYLWLFSSNALTRTSLSDRLPKVQYFQDKIIITIIIICITIMKISQGTALKTNMSREMKRSLHWLWAGTQWSNIPSWWPPKRRPALYQSWCPIKRTISLEKIQGTTHNPNKVAVQSRTGEFLHVIHGRWGVKLDIRDSADAWTHNPPLIWWAAVEDADYRVSIKSQWDSETSLLSRPFAFYLAKISCSL